MKNFLLATCLVLLSGCSMYSEDIVYNHGSEDKNGKGKALLHAITIGKTREAKRLINNQAPLNYQADNACTALAYAVYHQDLATLKALLKAGADVNIADNAKRSPLMWSAMMSSPDYARLLIEYGADIDAIDLYGRSALQYAVVYGNKDMIRFLNAIARKPHDKIINKKELLRLKK